MTTPTDERDEKALQERARVALARRLRTLREARGWSVTEAANVANMGRSEWYRLEACEHDPSLRTLFRLQRAFGLATLEELFGTLPTGCLSGQTNEPGP